MILLVCIVGNVIALCSVTMLVNLIRRWAKLAKGSLLLWFSLQKLRYLEVISFENSELFVMYNIMNMNYEYDF
jgi:hypothetical protein